MDCLHSRPAWICGSAIAKDGLLSPRLEFSPKRAAAYFLQYCQPSQLEDEMLAHQMEMPCGKCALCEKRKRKDMSTRLCNELSMHDCACFVTLTYNDSNLRYLTDDEGELAAHPTLSVRDVQLFLKRLRRHIEYHEGKQGIRYFLVGEYGSKSFRPHYHLIIFGWKPQDLDYFFTHKGNIVYRSKTIESLWTFGFSSLSEVSSAVAKYAARYVTKKFVGRELPDDVVREFILQSRKDGGIGSTWLAKWKETLAKGFVTYLCGRRVIKAAIPQYYLRRLRKLDIEFFELLRDYRMTVVERKREQGLIVRKGFQELANEAECFVNQLEHEKDMDI